MQESMATSVLPSSSAAADLEALKQSIMAEIEGKLSMKEDHLWKRGQVEIKRLQQDNQLVKDRIGQIQERQANLLSENKQIRGALLEVTSRFELVVKEMREVLRALPQQQQQQHGARPSGSGLSDGSTAAPLEHLYNATALQPSPTPSLASTSASEALREELSPDASYEPAMKGSVEKSGCQLTPSTGLPSQQSPPAKVQQSVAGELHAEIEDMPSATFCTPPRNDMAAAQDSSLDMGTTGSPAVLSLAKSLPPASTATPNSSPGACKRLQLAECLNGGQASSPPNPSSSTSLPAPPSPPDARQKEPTPSPARQFDFVKVDIVKEPGFVTLGIEVNQVDGVSLCVEHIDEHGLVGRHNAQQDARSRSRVLVGDRLIEVNGIRQDPNLMLQECKARPRLSFTIARDSARTQALHKASSEADAEDARPEEEAPSRRPSSGGRLRPEASVFVPASQVQEAQSAPPLVLPAVAVVPPGFESYDTAGLLTLPTGSSLGTQFASMMEAAGGVGMLPPSLPPPPGMPLVGGATGYDHDEEVKRALFP